MLELERSENDASIINHSEENEVAEITFGVDYGKRSGTWIGMVVNLCNTVVGAGIIALPYAVSRCGYIVGAVLMVMGGVLTQLGMHLLYLVMDKLKGDQLSFGRVAMKVHKFISPLISFLVWLLSFTISVVYLGVAADFLVLAAAYFVDPTQDALVNQRSFWLTLVFLLFCTPLSIPVKTTVLQYTSGVAVIFIFYTVVLVVVYAFVKTTDELCTAFLTKHGVSECVGTNCCAGNTSEAPCCIGEFVAATGDLSGVVSALAVIVTGFGASVQAFAFYNDLENPTVRRLDTATVTAFALVSLFYLLIAFGGYYTYGSEVSSDLLGSYPLTLETTLARIGMAALTTLSYPLMMHPCRDTFAELIQFPLESFLSQRDKALLLDPRSVAHHVFFYFSLGAMLLATFAFAFLEIDIGTLLEIAGSLSVSNLTFTIPGVFFLSIIRESGPTLKCLAVCLIILGLALMVMNIAAWIAG